MTNERYKRLMVDGEDELTRDEIYSGWHWCHEFDGLLVGPQMGEFKFCKCLSRDEFIRLRGDK